jgi:hypothetical protein
MTQVLFNQFAYTDRLARGGFTPEQARASAEALETAFSEAVATKSDIAEVKADLKADIAAVRSELAATETRLVSAIHSTVYKGVGLLAAIIGFIAIVGKFWK